MDSLSNPFSVSDNEVLASFRVLPPDTSTVSLTSPPVQVSVRSQGSVPSLRENVQILLVSGEFVYNTFSLWVSPLHRLGN